jgi:hypothetical protein
MVQCSTLCSNNLHYINEERKKNKHASLGTFFKNLITTFDELWTKLFHCKPPTTGPKWPNSNFQTMLPTKTIVQILSQVLHLQLIWKYKNFILSQFFLQLNCNGNNVKKKRKKLGEFPQKKLEKLWNF